MGVMTFLRERLGKIVAITIGVALLFFIIGEVAHFGGAFFRGDANTIGVVAGKKISYQEFNDQNEQSLQQFRQQQGEVNDQMLAYVQQNTWNQIVSRTIVDNQIEKLNLVVGEDEIVSMTSGSDPDPQVKQAFTDPQTREFNRAQLDQVLRSIKTASDNDPTKQQWLKFVDQVVEQKKAQKYVTLISNGLYVNSLEAKADYEAKNKLANFKYVALDYASIPDDKVTITDADYEAYYNDHKAMFDNKQEVRSFSYVSFNGAPAKDDTLAIKAHMEKVVQDFKASNNDSLFVQVNSEAKEPIAYRTKAQLAPLGPEIDSAISKAAKGDVVGPFVADGGFKVAKLVDARVGPDSVKASHILISPNTAGTPEKAMARIDSLKKLIEGGKSFADLAKTYSEDTQSAKDGGSVGTFGRGAMVGPFEEAAFNGKVGDLKVVTTQFGVHLIHIDKQVGSSKVYKVAVVTKPIVPSEKTRSAAYGKAQAFLSNVSGKTFDAQAKKENLSVMPAQDVDAMTSTLPGLPSARDLVKWAYGAEVGDVSDRVFIIGNSYVVAKLTQVKPEGVLPLDLVKSSITPAARDYAKARILLEKLNSATNGASSIEQVASKAGSKVNAAENVVMANPVIPGLGIEYSVVGSIFGSQPNKLSKPVKGTMGVYAFVVTGFVNPAPLSNVVKQKEQLTEGLQRNTSSALFVALKDKADVKDYRAKFL